MLTNNLILKPRIIQDPKLTTKLIEVQGKSPATLLTYRTYLEHKQNYDE